LKTILKTFIAIPFALTVQIGILQANEYTLSPIEKLGEQIFHDTSLSLNQNQACVSCHDPKVGWTSPNSEINEHGAVVEGSIAGEFGNRKPPSSAYANVSPRFYADFGNRLIGQSDDDNNKPRFIGGNFWDGRATGWNLGNPAADQSQGPFLNPVEHALPNPACAVQKVCNGNYVDMFNAVWSPNLCRNFNKLPLPANLCEINDLSAFDPKVHNLVSEAYDRVALSIAAFEGSKASNSFTSKVDAVRASRGNLQFTAMEERGRILFRDVAKCTTCHTGAKGPGGAFPLLTDFSFSNIGTPKNPENPFSIANPDKKDIGLAGFLETVEGYEQYAKANRGKVKVPTIRNVALGSCEPVADPLSGAVTNADCVTKAYMHNGYFKSLKSVVHFYNTRDIKPKCESLNINNATEEIALSNNCWPKPEIKKNMEMANMGNLGLSEEQENELVAFMQALSDGYVAPSSNQ